ncbi:MAG: hypothetical protein NZ928_06945, partial [Endomicrobia bacterium]|nr:hypothetical protein [Endomicrobiia bacterium]
SLINPYGVKGILMPVNIFRNYGYKVFENQPVWFIDKVVKNYPLNLNYKILLAITTVSWIWKIIISITKNKPFSSFIILCFLFSSIVSLIAIRNFAIFGYLSIVFLTLNLSDLKFTKKPLPMLIVILFCFILVYKINPYIWKLNLKVPGLKTNNESAAMFFLHHNLNGPILNNYDVGGYLIYYLYPKEKVFVDNRPEAYPENFFTEVYLPMMENESKWLELDRIYNFNVIFFYRHDFTPWGQKFLINRVFDKNWAVVFVDQDCIILLKRIPQNKSIIDKFELPKDIFKIVKTV